MATNIPITQIVNADITIQNPAVEEQNFNNLLLVTTQNTTPPIIPKSERVRLYASTDAVISDFGADSEAAKEAQIWFSQDPKPEEILITLRYGTGGTAPDFTSSVLGRAVNFSGALTQWQGITDGSFEFLYNNIVFTLSNMDFSSVLVETDVVDIIQAILNDIQPSNLNINLSDQAGNPLADELWTSIVAVTGELIFNYDITNSNFYLTSTSITKNYVSVGAASFGTDISVSNLTNLTAGYFSKNPISAAYSSNDFTQVIDYATDFAGVTDGSFNMNVNAVTADYTGIDFTNANNNQDVAAIIGSTLTNGLGYDVTVGLTTGTTLVIQSLTTDMTITDVVPVSPATGTDISVLAFSTPAIVSPAGTYLETPPEAIVAASELNNNWYGVALTKEGAMGTEVSFANIELTAGYIQSVTKQYYARLVDLDIASSSKTDNGSTLANLNLTRTVPCFHELGEYLDAAAAGNLLVTIPGSSVLMFKTAQGVSASSVNVNGQRFVLDKNVNIQSLIGGRSMIRNGTVSGTQIQFADIIRFVDWLTNEIEVNVFALLSSAAKVPYTDTGVNILKGGVKQALDQGVANGGIATSIDDSGNVIPSYTITAPRVATVPISQRANRISPDINFEATLGNAIQKITVRGTVSV